MPEDAKNQKIKGMVRRYLSSAGMVNPFSWMPHHRKIGSSAYERSVVIPSSRAEAAVRIAAVWYADPDGSVPYDTEHSSISLRVYFGMDDVNSGMNPLDSIALTSSNVPAHHVAGILKEFAERIEDLESVTMRMREWSRAASAIHRLRSISNRAVNEAESKIREVLEQAGSSSISVTFRNKRITATRHVRKGIASTFFRYGANDRLIAQVTDALNATPGVHVDRVEAGVPLIIHFTYATAPGTVRPVDEGSELARRLSGPRDAAIHDAKAPDTQTAGSRVNVRLPAGGNIREATQAPVRVRIL